MSRFGFAISEPAITGENQSAARGRIMDADFAAETANLSRAQILQQAGTAMVAQANQLPQRCSHLLEAEHCRGAGANALKSAPPAAEIDASAGRSRPLRRRLPMATISSAGIGSGLDVNSIITQLMAIEQQPLTALQTKATTIQSTVSEYGKIKSAVSTLRDLAAKLASTTTWGQTASNSSSTAVAATTSRLGRRHLHGRGADAGQRADARHRRASAGDRAARAPARCTSSSAPGAPARPASRRRPARPRSTSPSPRPTRWPTCATRSMPPAPA